MREIALLRPYFLISPENNISSIAFFSLVTITPSSGNPVLAPVQTFAPLQTVTPRKKGRFTISPTQYQ